MEFYDWINAKFFEWSGNRRAKLTDFAAYVGISHSLMSQYMNPDPDKRKKPRDKATIAKFYKLYGDDIYSALGMKTAASGADWLASLSPAVRSKFNSAYIAALRELELKGIDSNTPEGERLISDVLERAGL